MMMRVHDDRWLMEVVDGRVSTERARVSAKHRSKFIIRPARNAPDPLTICLSRIKQNQTNSNQL